ncbi:nuclear transport factor 2 family protein [Sphingomonas sp. AOB5]|uniref:nuclear transport factor 2 family protein n=1 Tax=Sphingomonas sp. AOB5 TaxID=3034017 RepID=UPI0023F985D7|nr:nuclear transport factor 2 family protein [Sphingomonas sp. AOB5]MDF7777747.1 nuclear transport factor 2 family protein [Sphingomonas sp. AOB5]
MPGTQTPAERIRHAYARWAESKGASADLFLDLMADDIVCSSALSPHEDHPLAKARTGKEFARDYLESLPLNLDMIDYPTDEIVDGGDTVVWIGRCSWRERATGKETSTVKVDVWRFRDGKAVSVLEMFDTLGFARLNRMI